jgi:xylulokinase
MTTQRYLLGLDVGSSFVKASLVHADRGIAVASASAPATEMAIESPRPGWAEQHPDDWWTNIVSATRRVLREAGASPDSIAAVGVSYQMHGLVLVDRAQRVLRPAIIWCDSRAVGVGEWGFEAIGRLSCLARYLNSPGNFTASKLKWVKDHEPEVFAATYKAMLPGDYVAMRLTGDIATTTTGLSEAILWDYLEGALGRDVLDVFGLSAEVLPAVVPTLGPQGHVRAAAAAELGLCPGIPVSYRAGDQPNNAFSLGVLEPGEVAATAGTSGVVYGVNDQATWDQQSRVNTFLHVNHSPGQPRYGVLLCVNGTGALYSWLKRTLGGESAHLSYDQMNAEAAATEIGADGLLLVPYGNGAERTLANRNPGASLHGLSLVRHGRGHLCRAAQEGIAFALRYGLDIMRDMGVAASSVRAGRANLFLSPLFAQAFADICGASIELFETDGAQGAARAAGVGAGIFPTIDAAFAGLHAVHRIEPDGERGARYAAIYERWRQALEGSLTLSATIS